MQKMQKKDKQEKKQQKVKKRFWFLCCPMFRDSCSPNFRSQNTQNASTFINVIQQDVNRKNEFSQKDNQIFFKNHSQGSYLINSNTNHSNTILQDLNRRKPKLAELPLMLNVQQTIEYDIKYEEDLLNFLLQLIDPYQSILIDIPLKKSLSILSNFRNYIDHQLVFNLQAVQNHSLTAFSSSQLAESDISINVMHKLFQNLENELLKYNQGNYDLILSHICSKYKRNQIDKFDRIYIIPFWSVNFSQLFDKSKKYLSVSYKTYILNLLNNYESKIEKCTLVLPGLIHIQDIINILSIFQELRYYPIEQYKLFYSIKQVGLSDCFFYLISFGENDKERVNQLILNNSFLLYFDEVNKEQKITFYNIIRNLEGISSLFLIKFCQQNKINGFKKQEFEELINFLKEIQVSQQTLQELKQVLFLTESSRRNSTSQGFHSRYQLSKRPSLEEISSYDMSPLSAEIPSRRKQFSFVLSELIQQEITSIRELNE